MEFLGFLVLLFWVGYIVSCFITFKRSQHVVRRRVEARGGRPIDGVELWGRLGWCVVKSFFWPVNLGLWLWLGRPEPGTYRRPAPPASPAASHRPSAPSSAPPFPGGPAVGTGPTAKAPFPSSGAKSGSSIAAYVPTPSAPAAPSNTPSPVLPLPRAQFGAPQLDGDYAVRMLRRAGLPLTPHNVFAAQERLGILFSVKARQFIEGLGTERDWATFLRRAGYPTADMHTWPQNVLNAIAQWDGDSIPHIQDFYARYSAILLESGGYLDVSPDEPLPTATDWHMQGIAQPDARPLPAPR